MWSGTVGRRPLLDRTVVEAVGDVNIARAVHRHAIGTAQSRGHQRGQVLLAAVHSLIALLPVSAI